MIGGFRGLHTFSFRPLTSKYDSTINRWGVRGGQSGAEGRPKVRQSNSISFHAIDSRPKPMAVRYDVCAPSASHSLFSNSENRSNVGDLMAGWVA
jgi:hypothetical protein